MAQQVIDVGTSASDGTGDPLREAFTKINDNFTELYTTVDNEGLTYGNVASNVAGITFNVTRYTESYAASPVLRGTGQVVGNVYLIQGNVLGGSTPFNDVKLTVTTLANVTVGNIATVSATGIPIAPVLRVNGLTGNVNLTVNNITGAASKAYVNAAIAANIANVTGSVTDSLSANITAANLVISNHAARIATLESNAATQATAITNLTNTRATITYVDTSISVALSSNAILANVAAVNANVAAANAAILLRANLSGATFTGNISANAIAASNNIRTNTYFVGGTAANQGLGQAFANPAALFFGNSAQSPGPGGNRFYQLNLQNLDPVGSGDLVVTSDDGNDGNNFISMGISGSQFVQPLYPSQSPHDGYVYIIGGNLDIQSETGNVELMAGNLINGQVILTQSNILKLTSNLVIQFSDGTVQSTAFGGNGNVASINANVTAANAAISSLQANAASQALDINNLFANAATQATSIITLTSNAALQATALNTLNANLGSYQTFANTNAASQTTSINLINANIAAANLNITSLLANATTQALDLNNLQGNAQTQQVEILALQSNAVSQAVQINLINANVVVANTNITNLSTNAATQATQINLINSNITVANTNIATLQTNAAFQASAIENLQANVNFYLSNVATSNANIAAANARIIIIDANLGSTSTNVSTLQSNAITQATQIDLLNANVAAANITIDTKANLVNGNIQANYLIANANVKIASTLEVGNLTPITYPGLAGVFVGNTNSYYQVVVHNLNSGPDASGDFVITADDGTDTNYYINIGINSSGFSGNFEVPAGDTGIIEYAHDGYITVIGGNTALRSDNNVFLAANTSAVALLKDGDLVLARSNLQFRDGTVQSSAIQDVPGLYANIGTIVTQLVYGNANVTQFLSSLTSVRLGQSAGNISQGTQGIAIGVKAGSNAQSNYSIAIGSAGGYTGSPSFGNSAGEFGQGAFAVAIGSAAGAIGQGTEAVAIGDLAGAVGQGTNAVAVGLEAGKSNQGSSSIAIGYAAGQSGQGTDAIAIGDSTAASNQGSYAVALGFNAGETDQGSKAVAIGYLNGNYQQGVSSIALGEYAGNDRQGNVSIAIGKYAGYTLQGNNSIAIGENAGRSSQHANSIVINASTNNLNTTAEGLFINPIRQVVGENVLIYNSTTKEITWSNIGNVSYTPNNAANYNGTVTNIQQALDQLAARLRALGG